MTDQITYREIEGDFSAAHAIRRIVFIEEQNVPAAEEWDDLDSLCRHFLGLLGARPIACGRLLPIAAGWKIQRVAVLAEARGLGVGAELMRVMIAAALEETPQAEVVLDAQTHALRFYERLGFVAEGPEFDDAGIPHRKMRLIGR